MEHFKDKIKNLQTDYNPQAWNQMSQLLDQAGHSHVKGKWNKSRLFLMLFFTIGIAAVSTFFINRNTSEAIQQSAINSQNNILPNAKEDTKRKENEMSTEKLEIQNQDKIFDKKTSQNTILEDVTAATTAITASSTNHRNGSTIQGILEKKGDERLYAQMSNKSEIQNAQVSIKNEKVEDITNNQTSKSESIDGEKKIDRTEETLHDQIDKAKDINNVNKVENNANIATSEIEKHEELQVAPILKPSHALVYNPRLMDLILDLPQKQIIKHYRPTFLNLEVGYSIINIDHGYHIGFTGFKEMNKLIGLMPIVQYATGYTKNVTSPGSYSRSREYDLGLAVNLFLFNKADHRLSVDLGLSYSDHYNSSSFRNGQGEIEDRIDITKGRGYIVGLSYNYLIKNSVLLGLSARSVSFDDAANAFTFRIGKSL
jgi:hypothetical protein